MFLNFCLFLIVQRKKKSFANLSFALNILNMAFCSFEDHNEAPDNPIAKGQLISKCPILLSSPKKQTKFFQDFCPSL